MNSGRFDVDRARRETPGCNQVVHLNNAGASLQPTAVLHAVSAHLRREAEVGGYEAGAEATEALERPYTAAAALLNCQRSEIAVVESATRAWQMAFASVGLEPGDAVLTSSAEYGSNYLQLLHTARRRGVRVEVVPDDEHGQVSLAALDRAIDERVKMVAITHVPTGGGLVNPVAGIGRITRAAGVTFLLDACQSFGQVPIDAESVGCDFLAATSRKFVRGPRGVGLLYARAATTDQFEPAFIDVRSATWTAPDSYAVAPGARRFEAFEISTAAKIGFGVALDYARNWGVDAVWTRIRALGEGLRDGLAAIPGVEILDRGQTRGAIVTFSVAGRHPDEVRTALRGSGVNVWVVEAATARLDFDHRAITAVVRASVHYYNDDDDLERCCRAVMALPRLAPG
ncbi:MAG: aminotransferase class V-fold PLP-dependent enzyme [Actinomycetota bacterium]|nr:aminotransferase class V-fold PLP-dependent enzyme [Actinomycetota bacterium]